MATMFSGYIYTHIYHINKLIKEKLSTIYENDTEINYDLILLSFS